MSIFLLKDPDAVFIHIPKTGGLTIRKGVWSNKPEGPLTEWKEEWDDLFSFAFIRHPLDRFVSAFYMFTEGTNKLRPKFSSMTINTFADRAVYQNDIDKSDGIAYHTLPMTNDFLCLDKAKFVGRYERYEADLLSLMKKLKVRDEWIPKFNVSQRYGDWQTTIREQMDPDTFDRLIDFYSNDFKELKYDIPRMESIYKK